ncbi:hypothetical protein Cpir12675_000679 [Ceratocystis pirilliformis]|uniref:6-phosphogluconolactonase n=1 Tax=Ceratocystis pirilliformis TaxID=259994 RepID=A0ABR3ZL55_9PEZI
MRFHPSLALLAASSLSIAMPAGSPKSFPPKGGSFFETSGAAKKIRAPADQRKLLVGSPANITLFSFSATDGFVALTSDILADSGPSWMALKAPSTLYAVNENSNTIRQLGIDTDTDTITPVTEVATSSGAVHLEFAPSDNQLISSVYGSGVVDVFSIGDKNNLALQSTWTMGAKGTSKPHQTLIDPSGKFAVTNDLGLNEVIITPIDASSSDSSKRFSAPDGCGPRHGAFLSGSDGAVLYAMVCETGNMVVMYTVATSGAELALTQTQTISTFPEGVSKPDARAGELVASSDSRHVYVSNRLSGDDQDSITHYLVTDDGKLEHSQTVPSGGLLPRMMSLATKCNNEDLLFVGNQGGEKGLVAFKLGDEGAIGHQVASLPISVWGTAENSGPQFVQEIALC